MKNKTITVPEILYLLSFLLFLLGSAIALSEHGAELSLWIMTFAVVITFVTTTFPWLGIHWLKLEPKGSRSGWWVALMLQIASWGSFGYAMLLRLRRDLTPFYKYVILTTIVWAIWLLVFIYSRHAYQPDDKLNP